MQTEVDVQGADDQPGQKDLNALSVNYGDPGAPDIDVSWNWDDTSTSGTNTRDGGALFDTDGDGNANYVFYITVAPDNTWISRVYICTSDAKPDRCTGPSLDTTFTSSATVAVVANTDPFGPGGSNAVASHSSGNTCRSRPACYTADTVAVTDLDLADFGNVENDEIKLLNVCSYPSGEPNSDPSDCVLAINPGTLKLVKVVDNLGYVGPGLLGTSDFPLTIDANPTTSGTVVSVLTGNHTISEAAVNNYDSGQWVCTGGTVTSTVNRAATVTVASGANVVCTMTNTLQQNFVRPALSIVKTATPTTYNAVGNIISYSYLVTNSGNVTLSGPFTVSDDKSTDESCPATASLAVGASITCTASYTITQADLDSGSVTNIASASNGTVTSPTDTETVTAIQTRTVSITKTATEQSYDSVGDVINYTIVATNTGNVSQNLTVSDPKVSDLSCTPANGSSVAPQQSMTCTASHTITQEDLEAGEYLNTSCVDATGATQACDSEDVNATITRTVSITKTATEQSYDSVGDVINYTIVATNTGNVAQNLTVSDPKVDNLICTPENGSSVAPNGGTMTCTASHTITQADIDAGEYLNTSCVDATGATQACDDEETSAVPNLALLLVKTARIKVITYSFVITNVGNTTLSTIGLTDPLFVSDENPTGLLSGCTTQTLAPGGFAICEADYTVTDEDYENGFVTNIATATAAGGVLTTATVTITPLTVVSPTPTPIP